MKDKRNAIRHGAALLLAALLFAGCTLRPAQSETAADPVKTTDPTVPTADPGPETPQNNGDIFAWETEPQETEEAAKTPDGQPDPARAEAGEYPTITAGHWWKFEDGTFVYDFPERDRSGEENLNTMYDIPNVPFDDVGYDANGQPNGQDWFSGRAEYNEETGESTILWERSASTQKSFADHRGFYRGDTSRKVVYFTFDCGYEQDGLTGMILDTLKEKHVSGTFFINGYYVDSAADYIRRMLDEGHIVANHALNHEMLTAVSVQTFYNEVIGLENKYYAAFPDAPPMLYFRPPSGNCNNWVLTYAEKLGYITALYSFAYTDWEVDNQPDLDASLANLKAKLHPGCVYLFHTVSETNTKLIPLAIDWIREQGYEIIPLCDIEA
ncbi:MAG: polysaccharide deacetylase family protein [Clostridiales bacterium]|nr:polysaccharide deacetylase family protein [Clostridiales bacterium]